MNSSWIFVGLCVLFYVIAVESKPEVNKVKIIVPHKIKYIHHHHHHRVKGFPLKHKKQFYKTSLKSHYAYRNEDDDVDDDEEDDIEESYNDSGEETDTSKRQIVYYAIPAAEFSKSGNNLSVKPVLLYRNDRHRGLRHVNRDKMMTAHSGAGHPEPHRPGHYLQKSVNPRRHPRPRFRQPYDIEYDIEI